ncbi:MAG: hypothetical protein ACEQSR_01390 [Candidatus Methylacidiphilales bacterium]
MKTTDKKALEQYQKKLEFARSAGKPNPYETAKEKKERLDSIKKIDWKYLIEYYFPHYATSETADFQIEYCKKVEKDPTFTGFAKWGRGLAKSVFNNVIIPFGFWLKYGKYYFVLIGVNETRATRLLEDLRAEFEANPRIIADFGLQQTYGSWNENLWITKGGFIGQALGFGQSCRGLRVVEKRPDHYNCDDLETRETIKNEKRQDEMVEWVENELLPSMDGANERLVFSNNWFAETMFLRKLAIKHPDWYVHEVKAYNTVTYEPRWKAKYKPDYYRNKETKMGILAAHAEYNHEAKPKGKIFKPENISWEKLPNLNHFKIIVGHWDIAYAGTESADYNAVRIWGLSKQDRFLYIQSFVKQSKMAAAVAYMCDVQKRLPKTVIIHWRFESQFWNDEVNRTIKEVSAAHKVNLLITKVDTPKGKKYDRILTLEPYFQNNRIGYNKDMESDPDTQVGLKQLYGIEPNYSGHDDSPDADQQAIAFLEKHITIGGNDGDYQSGKMEPNNERI